MQDEKLEERKVEKKVVVDQELLLVRTTKSWCLLVDAFVLNTAESFQLQAVEFYIRAKSGRNYTSVIEISSSC